MPPYSADEPVLRVVRPPAHSAGGAGRHGQEGGGLERHGAAVQPEWRTRFKLTG